MSRASALLVIVGPREEVVAAGGVAMGAVLDAAEVWRPAVQ